MDSHHIAHLLGILAIVLAAARVLGSAARSIGQLLRAGASSTAVAVAGVALPFAGGYFVCHFFGMEDVTCIVAALP